MKSSLPIVFVLLIRVLRVGFYLRRFTVSSVSPGAGSHERNINRTVDWDKIYSDTETVMYTPTSITWYGNAHLNRRLFSCVLA